MADQALELYHERIKKRKRAAAGFFNEVLGAILSLSHEFIKLPDPAAELPEDNRWKWFPDGLGALDGTHVDVRQ
jgi:hypothetical protein